MVGQKVDIQRELSAPGHASLISSIEASFLSHGEETEEFAEVQLSPRRRERKGRVFPSEEAKRRLAKERLREV